MSEPQVTNSFSSKEEENRFYVEAGKAEAYAEVLGVVDSTSWDKMREYGKSKFTIWSANSETQRGFLMAIDLIKTRIQAKNENS